MSDNATTTPDEAKRDERMPWESEFVWYACYGSNLDRQRFSCYIEGGRPTLAENPQAGCTCQCPSNGATKRESGVEECGRCRCSKDCYDDPIILPYNLVFARDYGPAANWGKGGVAFLDRTPLPEPEDPKKPEQPEEGTAAGHTYARLYRVRRDQFIDIFAQENGYDPRDYREEIESPFGALKERGWRQLHEDGEYDEIDERCSEPKDYSRLLMLGSRKIGEDLEPVYTFTRPSTLKIPLCSPSKNYLTTIIMGLFDTVSYYTDEVIAAYLAARIAASDEDRANRVKDEPKWDKEKILKLVVSKREEWLNAETQKTRPGMGRHLRVRGTSVRDGNRRDFIAQLHPSTREDLNLKARNTIYLERPFVLRAEHDAKSERLRVIERPWKAETLTQPMRVTAVVNLAQEREDERKENRDKGKNETIGKDQIALDEKLRVSLGVNKGGCVKVSTSMTSNEIAGRTVRKPIPKIERFREAASGLPGRVGRFINRVSLAVVGVQPQLMRVGRATFEDMEINICRVPESTFEVLGIAPGDSVLITFLGKPVVLRAAKISAEAKKERDKQHKREPATYPDPRKLQELDLVSSTSGKTDIPPIYIDYDARTKLGVLPVDVVRVVRAPTGAMSGRAYIVLIPLVLVMGTHFLGGDGTDPVGSGTVWMVFAAMVGAMLAGVAWDLRNDIR